MSLKITKVYNLKQLNLMLLIFNTKWEKVRLIIIQVIRCRATSTSNKNKKHIIFGLKIVND